MTTARRAMNPHQARRETHRLIKVGKGAEEIRAALMYRFPKVVVDECAREPWRRKRMAAIRERKRLAKGRTVFKRVNRQLYVLHPTKGWRPR